MRAKYDSINRVHGENETEMKGKPYQVGRHALLLPLDHGLDEYQKLYPRYDRALGDVARAVREKYPAASVIDIGANVGDSAALICANEDVPVLAIEGNEQFMPYLLENVARLGSHIDIYEGYVGPEGVLINAANALSRGGATSLVSARGGHGAATKFKSLAEILAIKSKFADARLLKIDTDGYDFEIIITSSEYLAKNAPVIFFEYYIGFRIDDERCSLQAIGELMKIGYHQFIVWDNFGHFMLTTSSHSTFEELNAFLRSNRESGTAVYYLDVCAFHDRDRDLFKSIRCAECSR
jgi:FkbM family methyltransferase